VEDLSKISPLLTPKFGVTANFRVVVEESRASTKAKDFFRYLRAFLSYCRSVFSLKSESSYGNFRFRQKNYQNLFMFVHVIARQNSDILGHIGVRTVV